MSTSPLARALRLNINTHTHLHTHAHVITPSSSPTHNHPTSDRPRTCDTNDTATCTATRPATRTATRTTTHTNEPCIVSTEHVRGEQYHCNTLQHTAALSATCTATRTATHKNERYSVSNARHHLATTHIAVTKHSNSAANENANEQTREIRECNTRQKHTAAHCNALQHAATNGFVNKTKDCLLVHVYVYCTCVHKYMYIYMYICIYR